MSKVNVKFTPTMNNMHIYTYKCANKNTTVNVFMKSTTMVHLFSIKLRLVTNIQMTDEAGGKILKAL